MDKKTYSTMLTLFVVMVVFIWLSFFVVMVAVHNRAMHTGKTDTTIFNPTKY